MAVWLGGLGGTLSGFGPGYDSPPWRLYLSLNDLSDPGPSRTLLFWDEREDSINLGNFGINNIGVWFAASKFGVAVLELEPGLGQRGREVPVDAQPADPDRFKHAGDGRREVPVVPRTLSEVTVNSRSSLRSYVRIFMR